MDCECLKLKPLKEAIFSGNVKVVRDLISTNPELCHPTCTKKYDYFSPLWVAILRGYEEIVQLLLEFGANPNELLFDKEAGSLESLTFFHVMSMKEDCPSMFKIAEILISHGADVNSCPGNTQRPPIDLAIQQGSLECVEFLLKNGARLHGPMWKGRSPMLTVLCVPMDKQKEILSLLVKYGLDPGFHDDYGQNLLHLFIGRIQESHPDAFEIIKILLHAGVLLDEQDKKGYSPLCYSIVINKKLELVSFLLKMGANVNQKCNWEGHFPLSLAALVNDVDVVKLILSYGAEVNAKTHTGKTALCIACFQNREQIIRELVRNGAVVSMMDNDGNTPFSNLNCEENNYDECMFTMVKEFSKLSFEGHSICQKDVELIQASPRAQKLYMKCQNELIHMDRMKFYACFSYYYMLKISNNNVRKLANLTKNEEFVKMFKKKLCFSHYKEDLLRIFDEAVELRDKTLIVESRLNYIFSEFFPDLVIKKLAENLTAEDLPLE